MSFDEEWAQHTANASMQLNQLPADRGSTGSPSGPSDGLSSNASGKEKAARYIEETLGPDVTKAGTKADTKSEVITGSSSVPSAISPGALKGWQTPVGLSFCMTEWERQVKLLQNRLIGEMGALRNTRNLFRENEDFTASQFGDTPRVGQNGPYSRISDFY